jgi:transposase
LVSRTGRGECLLRRSHKFNISNLVKTERRKNLVIEAASFSTIKNSFLGLDKITSSLPFNDNISKNSILQYDSHKKSFIIISPFDKENKFKFKKYDKCGIDIGVRTFATTYNKNESFEIGTNTNKLIDSYNKRLDLIRKIKNK